jgi:hypothetical protein
VLSVCTIVSWFILFLFISIYIVIIIWISFSEVSSRHSRCQFAIVTNFILNGYYNPRNNNQYAGLVTIQQQYKNLASELQKLNTAYITYSANMIISANLPQYSATAFSQLNTIYRNYNNIQIQLPSGGIGIAPSTANLTPTLSP